MKNVEIKHIKSKYKYLEIGDAFIADFGSRGTYIVTDKKDEQGMQFAVNLESGVLTNIGADEEVIVAKNVIVEL